MRTIGWIFLLLGLVALGLDIWAWTERGGAFELRQLGLAWAELHRPSLLTLQPAIERHIHPDLYFAAVQPLLLLPAVPLLVGAGIGFMILSRLLGMLRLVRT